MDRIVIPYRQGISWIGVIVVFIISGSVFLHLTYHRQINDLMMSAWFFGTASGATVLNTKKQFILTSSPPSIHAEYSMVGKTVLTKSFVIGDFDWVRSRSIGGRFPSTYIDLGKGYGFEYTTIKMYRLTWNETVKVAEDRKLIATMLALEDRGHVRLPAQRNSS